MLLRVLRLEVQGDRGALRGVLDRLDRVAALTARLPPDAFARPRVPRHERDLVGHHEAGVETDAELADEVMRGGRVLRLRQLAQELPSPGLRERADQPDHLVTGHADPVVTHRERALLPVNLDGDVQIADVRLQVLVTKHFQPQLVQRVGGVGDQFPQEDVLARVDRVDHQLQQLTRLRLELERFNLRGHMLPFTRPPTSPESYRCHPTQPRHPTPAPNPHTRPTSSLATTARLPPTIPAHATHGLPIIRPRRVMVGGVSGAEETARRWTSRERVL